MNKEELNKSLQVVDLTLDKNHAIGIITDEIIKSLQSKYTIQPSIIKDSPIVDSKNNYDNLYYPQDTITKSSRYTRWINDTTLLRTQMTSSIPPALKSVNKDTLLICPGIVYRRDVVDKTHVGEPHQMDIWRITNDKVYNREDLLDLVQCVIDVVLPGVKWRYNETSHYYTKDGIEVEVYVNDTWLEILECGLALPKLLDDSGLDSNVWSGLAMGIGLDRSVMLRKGINDIRILRSQNPRIQKQMSDLSPYVEVSTQPSIIRDMSIAVDNDIDIEQIGDRIRTLIESNIIEEINIKGEWLYSDLPIHVSKRLGMNENMKNVLLSVVIRPLDITMTSEEANGIYDYLYKNLHMGDVGYYRA